MKRSITVFVFSLLLSSTAVFIEPLTASAGVLTRGGSSTVRVRVPRVRDRNVRSTTEVLKATNPDLKFHGQTLDKIYQRMQRQDRKYQQQLQRWERQVQRIRDRQKRLDQRKAEQEERKAAKARELRLKAEHKSTPAAQTDASVAHDPRAWFTQRIAGVGSGGSLSSRGQAPQQQPKVVEPSKEAKAPQDLDTKGKELAKPEKKTSIWTHVWRALGL